jgi:hypothetical protein
MMGQREFGAKLYYQLSLDKLVPQDHLLRRITSAVDFSFVRPPCHPYLRPHWATFGRRISPVQNAAGGTSITYHLGAHLA